MRHVIIGAGAAGLTAAKTIRILRPEDAVTVISADEYVNSRCMLHKYISDERDEQTVSFVDEDFFTKYDIQWLKGKRVTHIDSSARRVSYDGGQLDFDTLLIATGSNSVTPPIGSLRESENVFGLRHLTDAQAIKTAAADAQDIVVIGAGLVGLDAVYALVELGKKPVVVEMADSVLALNLDAHAAGAYQALFEQAGCEFYLGFKVTGTREKDGKITHVELDNGESLPCDMLIVAAGVRPAVEFLQESGIAYERAINVDEYLKTNIDGIYAAGDVAGLSGIWPNAMKQGEIAAKNMCGQQEAYTDTFAVKNTVNFFGLVTLSVGEREAQEGDVVYILEDRTCYNKAILRDGKVVGVILQGDISNSGFWQYLIKNKIAVDNIDKPVFKLSFADFFAIDDKGEFYWTAMANEG